MPELEAESGENRFHNLTELQVSSIYENRLDKCAFPRLAIAPRLSGDRNAGLISLDRFRIGHPLYDARRPGIETRRGSNRSVSDRRSRPPEAREIQASRGRTAETLLDHKYPSRSCWTDGSKHCLEGAKIVVRGPFDAVDGVHLDSLLRCGFPSLRHECEQGVAFREPARVQSHVGKPGIPGRKVIAVEPASGRDTGCCIYDRLRNRRRDKDAPFDLGRLGRREAE